MLARKAAPTNPRKNWVNKAPVKSVIAPSQSGNHARDGHAVCQADTRLAHPIEQHVSTCFDVSSYYKRAFNELLRRWDLHDDVPHIQNGQQRRKLGAD